MQVEPDLLGAVLIKERNTGSSRARPELQAGVAIGVVKHQMRAMALRWPVPLPSNFLDGRTISHLRLGCGDHSQ